MSLKKNKSHVHSLKVRYSEIDSQSIVYNSHYLTYYDISISDLMDQSFDQEDYIKQTQNEFHTVNVNMSYKAPANLNDTLEIYSAIKKIGDSSITFIQEIYKKNSDILLNTVEIIWVNTHQPTHKSVTIPNDIREKLNKFLLNQK